MIELHEGDCLEILPTLEANSVDTIITDPPYFRVKGEAWDRQWDSPAAFIAWLSEVVKELARVLKPNGSLYLFASPKMAARVEVMIGEYLNVLNQIVWAKPTWGSPHTPGQTDKDILRQFFPWTERIIFAEHHGADNIAKGEAGYQAKCDELRGFIFEPLRAYLRQEAEAARLSNRDINRIVGSSLSGGGMASHYVGDTGQWSLPTLQHYELLQAATSHFRREYDDLRREYEDLRREYEDLRREYEDLRRPFSVTPDTPYTDVWNFAPVPAYPGKHPCEKPQDMLEHMILTSTRPDAVILDCFMGSGATGQAARRLGRGFIGIDLDARYFAQARQRLSAITPADITERVKREVVRTHEKPRTMKMDLSA